MYVRIDWKRNVAKRNLEGVSKKFMYVYEHVHLMYFWLSRNEVSRAANTFEVFVLVHKSKGGKVFWRDYWLLFHEGNHIS